MEDKIKQKLELARKDPVFFIDRLCYTFDPRVEPYHLPFRLFPFQQNLVNEIKQAIELEQDIFIEKSRDVGATYTILDTLLWFWLNVPGSNFIVGSRKQDYVDSTGSTEVSNKEASLFGKLEYTLRKLPTIVLPKGFDFRKHFTFMSLVNPENGNAITGESSNPNFSRAGRYKAAMLDEFAFWDDDSAVWGATADSTRCRIVLTTPGIKPSKAKRLRFGKDGEKIKIVTISYELDPRKTSDWLEKERSRRSEQDFAREILINWDTSITGKVYEEMKHAQIGDFPYNPTWPLFVSWDFGLDGTCLQWWQHNLENGKMRLVDAYENRDKPIQFFFPLTGLQIDSTFNYLQDDLDAINAVKDFKKAVHYGDPDVSKRSLLTGTSTRQALEEVGAYVQTKPEANDFISRREKTKVLLQRGIEINQNKRTDYFVECLNNARYPQRQDESQATTPVNLPIHDWTSHNRTALEYFAVNYDSFNQAVAQKNAALYGSEGQRINDFDPFGRPIKKGKDIFRIGQ